MTDFNDEILPDTRPLILRLVEKRAGIEVKNKFEPVKTLGTPRKGEKYYKEAMAMDACFRNVLSRSLNNQISYEAYSSFIGYGMLSNLTQEALIRAGVETIADDMTRKQPELYYDDDGDGKEDLINTINSEMFRYKIKSTINDAMQKDGYFGGCLVYIDVGDLEDIREHLSELKDELIKCVQDQNGNHVIQKLIEKLPKGEHSEIIKAVKNKVYQLSIHQYGCRAIQRIFEFCTEEEKSAVLKEIYPIVNDLCIDQYGNYVIQNIVEKIKDNQIIYDSITGKIYNYSIHKYASNVIESCLSLGNKKQVEKIVKEIIEQDDHNSDVLISLVRDKLGNYVVQKMIEVSEMKSKEILVKKIVSSQVLNKRDGFSKHVIMMIEKLGLTQLLHQEGMNNNSNYYKSTKGQ